MQSLIRSKSAGVTGGRGTAGAGPGRDLLYLHATSSRIFFYQNQPVVQKAHKVFSCSHVKAKQDQECGGKVCKNTKGSASYFSHFKAKQSQDKL